MNRLTELAAKATPRPWSVEPTQPHDTRVWVANGDGGLFFLPTAVGIEGRWVSPRENAALIVALVNNLDAIQALFDAADEACSKCGASWKDEWTQNCGDSYNRCRHLKTLHAVESLRDLLGGDHAEDS